MNAFLRIAKWVIEAILEKLNTDNSKAVLSSLKTIEAKLDKYNRITTWLAFYSIGLTLISLGLAFQTFPKILEKSPLAPTVLIIAGLVFLVFSPILAKYLK